MMILNYTKNVHLSNFTANAKKCGNNFKMHMKKQIVMIHGGTMFDDYQTYVDFLKSMKQIKTPVARLGFIFLNLLLTIDTRFLFC